VVAHNNAPSSSGVPPTNKTSTATNAFTSNDHGDGNVKAADLDIKMLGVTKQTVIDLPDGGQDIRAAAAAPGADTDPSFNVQQQTKHIDGTAHDDVIHALDPNRMPSGTFERLIDVTGRPPMSSTAAAART
jgi:hypothetical protein